MVIILASLDNRMGSISKDQSNDAQEGEQEFTIKAIQY
jgi:hypothetical protein